MIRWLVILAGVAPAILPACATGRDLTLPDTVLTPGIVRALGTKEICERKWGKDARHVSKSMKREVMASYKFSPQLCPSGKIEIDHLIPRELAGMDATANLWPMCYEAGKDDPAFGAHKKDRIENRLHREVCAGNRTLQQAQQDIANDWRISYRRYYGE